MLSIKRSRYSPADYLYTLYLIHYNHSIGRYKLANYLGLSTAQTRTILSKLVLKKLIEKRNRRYGHHLSPHGLKLWTRCLKFIYIPSQRINLGSKYTIGKKDAVVCIEGSGIDQLSTVALRDKAFVRGALGCTVFFQDNSGDIYLLNAVYPPLPTSPLIDRTIRRKLKRMTSGLKWSKIVIIVGSANTIINAQIGAISAAFLLIPNEIREVFEDLS